MMEKNALKYEEKGKKLKEQALKEFEQTIFE